MIEATEIVGLVLSVAALAVGSAMMLARRRHLPVSRTERLGLGTLGAVAPAVTLFVLAAATSHGTHYRTNGWFFHLGLWFAPLTALAGIGTTIVTRDRWRRVAVGLACGGTALTLFVWIIVALFVRGL